MLLVMFMKWSTVFCIHCCYFHYPRFNFYQSPKLTSLPVLFINSLFQSNGIKSVLSAFVTIPLGIMENAVTNQVTALERRLSEAERRAKLLKFEIKSIQQEIATLQQSVCSTQNVNVKAAVTQGTVLLNTSVPRSTSVADGPISNRRPNTEVNEQPPNKRRRGSFTWEGEYVVVYTDGACENNGRPNARAGIGVWFGQDHHLNISKPVEGRPTNNHAEIQACIEALIVIMDHGGNKAKIFTDSEFTINCMTKWIHMWKINMWKTAKGGPVKNREELQVLDKIISKFQDVKWVHVAGHHGIKGNEEADKLARQGASKYEPST